MYTFMICEYNQQSDFCWLDHGAVEWHGRDGPRGFGAGLYGYPSIRRNIPVILLKEYNVYDYDLQI